MKKLYSLSCALLCFSLLVSTNTFSQLSITSIGSSFTENFDGMGTSATASLPTGFKIGTDWSTGTTATTLAYGTTGTGVVTSTSGGGVINWANGVTASSTDRALGFLTTGTFTSPRSIILKITNNTGSTIGSLNISFDYEKYRSGSRQFDWTFFHGSTSTATISANSGDQSFAADAANTTIYNPPTTTSKSFTISGLSIANGTDYYLRWTLTGLAGSTNGQGLAIDNFSISATALISSNADLSGLTLSLEVLTPAFASATTSYTASVGNATSSITVTPTTADGNATVTVNGATVTSGSASATIPLNVGDNTITTVVTAQDGTTTKTYTVTVNRAAAGVATLATTSALAGFGNVCINTTAGPNSFTLDGSGLDGTDINIGALPGFSYSLTSSGSYTSTLSFSYSGSGFTGQVIYVKFTPTAVQAYDGNISISGGGVSNYTVAAAGSGINTLPTVTTGAATNIAATTATAPGSITSNGCSSISDYGIEYSTSSGFANGTGTPLPASNLSGGNFSVNLTGLAPNTRYYYHAYATNGGGTSYGAQQAFNAAPLPVPMASQPGFSYTQDFSDIASWGSFFVSGNGANHFGGLSSNTTAPASGLPDPNKLTASTSNFTSSLSSGGVQRGTDQTPSTTSIVLLSTGSPDNTTSAAIDFYADFTGVNAGTLSFDYQSINNSTGDRNGSLRVYGSTDGTTWTEITNVLNFTNNSPISGSKSNIALPASFNNNANARIRFYYYNGTGGTTGSRPKIAIDNLTLTAVATTPCATPTAAATTLSFGTTTDVSIQGSFTAASPSADHYLVIASTSNSLTGNPVDASNYSVGDVVGEGTVVYNGTGTSFTATGLNPSTTYYFFVFSYNGVCTGGPLYYTTPLTGQQVTSAGLPPCTAPASQPSSLQFGATNSNSIQGSFTATTADEYLVLQSTSSSLSNNPVNGSYYNVGDVIGNGKVISAGTATSFTAANLSASTTYYFYVFSLNNQNCINGPSYNTASPLNGSQSTTALPACTTPIGQPAVLTLNASNNSVSGAFNSGSGADRYLVVRSTSSTLSATPADNTDYNAGDNLGGGIVVGNVTGNSFLSTGLAAGTNYYFFVFSENSNCSGGTKYLTSSPLTGSVTTSAPVTYNYYFGNWHSHSDYSDGNKDHPGYTPADDYTYAQTAQCMDYLGISEHNHFSSVDNPGNTIANYHLGPVQADNYTSTHTGFVAMYGMEWGVISGGGHVVVYGDGMNDLWGWESGSGGWGPTNNYDVYVAKSDYTGANGLFKTVNDNVGKNTFATLAHPNSTDYNNIAGTAYNATADDAIVGTAVESGPATSTNTTYTNPSSMSYLSYYQTLLAKGYHLGPVVDHDNHNTTFGHTTYSRTAVIASSLSKSELINGMRNMHFYATEDCDTKVDFSINTRVMGTIFADRYAPTVSVSLTDGTTSLSAAVIKLMFGVPGSGVMPTAIASATGSSMNFTDQNIPDLSTGYYYLDITSGTARIVTAPIWYTRNDALVNSPLPVKLESFGARKENNTVLVSWKTSQEMNTKEFWVERSSNGRDYQRVGILKAAGNSAGTSNYQFTDGKPLSGDNFYRLRTIDLDTKYELSRVVVINIEKAYTVFVSPNPASSFVDVTVANRSGALLLQITDMNGKMLVSQSITSDDTRVNVGKLSKGIYIVKISGGSSIYTQKLLVQ
jgi:trimeric autotransporter adhesin